LFHYFGFNRACSSLKKTPNKCIKSPGVIDFS